MTILTTERLTLEPIDARHFDGLRAISADPIAMRFLNGGRVETEEETRGMIERVMQRWQEWGYSWWALIDNAGGEMIGAACLQHLDRDKANPHEIGWRLARAHWGKGYASEAAREIVRHGFDVVGADVLYAVAHPDNAASINVMRKLGMRYVGIETHYDQPCATYRLDRCSNS